MSSTANINEDENIFYIRSRITTPNNQLYLDVERQGQRTSQLFATILGNYLITIVNKFNGNLSQQWIVNKSGKIRNLAYKHLYLDVKGQKGPSVIMWEPNGGDNQLWSYDGNYIYSMMKKKRNVLDVKGESKKCRTEVIIWKLNHQLNQQWDLIPVYQHPNITKDPFGNLIFHLKKKLMDKGKKESKKKPLSPSFPQKSSSPTSFITSISSKFSIFSKNAVPSNVNALPDISDEEISHDASDNHEQIQKTDSTKDDTIQGIQTSIRDFFQVMTLIDESKDWFFDKHFPPNQSSLFKEADKSIPSGISKVSKWCRPYEFADDPRLFVDGVSAGDVIQGHLGDCWFLGALSILGTRLHVISHCIVSQPSTMKQRGRFEFRFFQQYQWVNIEIDDLLPCDNSKQLVFAKCQDKNEMWVPLFEKAYAKLFGSYQALETGHPNNALVDLTGGVALPSIDITPSMKDEESLWNNLKSYCDMGCYFLSCCASATTEEEIGDTGILSAHAYSILSLHEIQNDDKKVKLFKIRNPWGEVEWKGKWSDNSKEWTKDIMEQLDVVFEDDGIFFMEFEDFCHVFTTLDIVRVFNDPIEATKRREIGLDNDDFIPGELEWKHRYIRGEWKGDNAGGVFSGNPQTGKKNPQYFFSLPNKTDVYISLMQKDARYQGDEKDEHFCIGFHVFKVPNDQENQKQRLERFIPKLLVSKTKFWENAREAVVEEINFSPGNYIIVPSTHKPGLETTFTLRVFARRTDFELHALPPFSESK